MKRNTSKNPKNSRKSRKSQQGQSMIEFAIMLPFFLMLTAVMVRMNMAINAGVVFQQYTRELLFAQLYNHRDYPRISWSRPANGNGGWQRLWVGMDEEWWPQSGRTGTPIAAVVPIDRSPAGGTEEEENTFPPETTRNVKVRVLSFICLPPKMFQNRPTQDANFVTERNNGMDSWYSSGSSGAHVRLCIDD